MPTLLSFNNAFTKVIYLFGKLFLKLLIELAFRLLFSVAYAANVFRVECDNLFHQAFKRFLVSLLAHAKCNAVGKQVARNLLNAFL